MAGMFGTERGPFDEPKTYWKSVIALVSHVAGTAFMFCAIATIAWTIQVFIGWLDGIKKFPDEVLSFVHGVELVILYIDTAFSAVVFFGGMYRFVKDLMTRGN